MPAINQTVPSRALRILFALPGLHRVARGAEAAFENLARELALLGHAVTLIGSGPALPDRPYTYRQAGLRPRERFARWPMFPPLRSDYRWEELSFVPGLWRAYEPTAYDVTLTCSYPFVNWILRARKSRGRRPAHVFVTENGDWPARRENSEYRLFSCDGLVCTNPEYYRRHSKQWPCALIPNGADMDAFTPYGPDMRADLRTAHGLPAGPAVLMVSALIPSKHVDLGIRAVARQRGVNLVLAGDGPLREECDALGRSLLGERFCRLTLPARDMPALYRSADLLLHLSREEAFGNIYIEAAACGLPVAAHDYPTSRWVLEDLGLYADTADEAGLDRLLQQGLEKDPGLNREERRRRIKERFAWPVVARQYEAFLREVTDARKEKAT